MLRIAHLAIGLAGVLAMTLVGYSIWNVREFEWAHLFVLFGWKGIAFVAALLGGLVLVAFLALRKALVTEARGAASIRRIQLAIVLAWALQVLWLAEWVFMEEPISVRLANARIDESERREVVERAVAQAQADGSIAALIRSSDTRADAQRMATMLARIRVNRPSSMDGVSIGQVIRKYSDAYGVNPILLLHWAYIDSFYGEAPSGPMPFFDEINGEMFRDLVQSHLPPFFIESDIREILIEGRFFNWIAGDTYGTKLRYALQKASYDIAISPFMNSVFSDMFLILREYPGEFPELQTESADSDPLAGPFRRLKDDTLLEPYHDPYSHPKRDEDYYSKHRQDLISFSRAAVYKLTSDFEFATKVQALVARYYTDQYTARLGADVWAGLSERQRTVLLAILRDVYTPNIGSLSYNVYFNPEFNCTPIEFVAGEAIRDVRKIEDRHLTWLPQDKSKLWGATGLMLRVLAETWSVATGDGLPGVPAADTTSDAILVLARNR